MYVWEMIACRLRGDGWCVWHAANEDGDGRTYTVHFHRPGHTGRVSGPTLTDAYAEAARRARACRPSARSLTGPHHPAMALARWGPAQSVSARALMGYNEGTSLVPTWLGRAFTSRPN